MTRPLDPEAPVNSPVDSPVSSQTQEGQAEAAAAVDVDLSGRPYEFNPPPHNSNLYFRTDYSNSESQIVGKAYAQYMNTGVNQEQTTFGWQRKLRLGRITMGNKAMNFRVDGTTRWGFRFMFNPPTWSGGSSFNQNIIPQSLDIGNLIIPTGLEVIQFTVTLNRMPDVSPATDVGDYYPNISRDALDGLRTRGTNFDLEYLYRVCNANRMTTLDGMNTADYGILLPGICWLTLGHQQFKGRVVQITAKHSKFSANMVPIHTDVTISFQRIAQMNEEYFKKYLEGGGWSTKRGGDAAAAPAAGGGGGGGGGVGSGSANAEKVWTGLKAQGFTDESAAGILGNLQQESGIEPTRKQGGGGPGRGIMQWTVNQRWATLTSWAQGKNMNPEDLDTQFQFMVKEMHDYGIYDRQRVITNIEEAVKYFHDTMEKSADKSMSVRNGYAHGFYNTYHK